MAVLAAARQPEHIRGILNNVVQVTTACLQISSRQTVMAPGL
jgi:hypothetical protein